MKTYVCDICNDCIDDIAKCVKMREIGRGGFLSKKQKIHLCSKCWFEIAKISRTKRSGNNAK